MTLNFQHDIGSVSHTCCRCLRTEFELLQREAPVACMTDDEIERAEVSARRLLKAMAHV